MPLQGGDPSRISGITVRVALRKEGDLGAPYLPLLGQSIDHGRGLFRMSAASPARIRIAPSAPSVTAARKNGEVASSDDMAETIIIGSE